MNYLKLTLFCFNIKLLNYSCWFKLSRNSHEMDQGSTVSFWISAQSLNVYLNQVIFFENPWEYIFYKTVGTCFWNIRGIPSFNMFFTALVTWKVQEKKFLMCSHISLWVLTKRVINSSELKKGLYCIFLSVCFGISQAGPRRQKLKQRI